jgi:hypothetical protein
LLRAIKRTLLLATVALATVAMSLGAMITWPEPLFAFSLGSGKITDRIQLFPPRGGRTSRQAGTRGSIPPNFPGPGPPCGALSKDE